MKTSSIMAVLLTAGSLLSLSIPVQALELKETFKDWAVYVHEQPGSKTCFAISKPKDMQPAGVNRGAVFFYVSSWPGEKVRNEISVKLGYPLAKGSAPTITVKSKQFTLFAEGDKAFIADETKENNLVKTMKMGATLIVKGRSKRGTETTDKYSLSGISSALKRVHKECK